MNFFKSKIIVFVAFSLGFFFFVLFFAKTALGQSFYDWLVSATIKISVCGDLVVEGPEDCEGDNLDGQTCQSLGLTSGNLACDIACEFDITACLGTPTSTPTSTPTLTPTPTSTPTITPTSAVTATPTPVTALASTTVPTSSSQSDSATSATPLPPTPQPTPRLPSVISRFDIDNNDHLTLEEIISAFKDWLSIWPTTPFESNQPSSQALSNCDLNRDSTCNLLDFSILLYFVDQP